MLWGCSFVIGVIIYVIYKDTKKVDPILERVLSEENVKNAKKIVIVWTILGALLGGFLGSYIWIASFDSAISGSISCLVLGAYFGCQVGKIRLNFIKK